MQEHFVSEFRMASLTNVTLKLTVHWPQHLKTTCRDFEDMAHERISVTAWIAEFLNWRDTGLLLIFNTYKHTQTHN